MKPVLFRYTFVAQWTETAFKSKLEHEGFGLPTVARNSKRAYTSLPYKYLIPSSLPS